jgi:hypothetical protein
MGKARARRLGGAGGMERPLRAASVTQRRQLWRIAIMQVLAMSVWFSTAAVVPSLEDEWGISSGAASWLTTSVQLIAWAALLAGVANLFVALASDGLASALPARVVAGVALAGVFPVGVKLIASWFDRGRSFAIGVLVGALTVGSAAPHLFEGLGSLPWRAFSRSPAAWPSRPPCSRSLCARARSRGRRAGCGRRTSSRWSRIAASASSTLATGGTCGSSTRSGPDCPPTSPRAWPPGTVALPAAPGSACWRSP